MSKNPEIPLHLYEALEEEFISLHGPIDDDITLELPEDGADAPPPEAEGAGARDSKRDGRPPRFRRVKAKRDWAFLAGHVKSPANFARDVLEETPDESLTIVADTRAPQAYDWAKRNLKRYLRGKLDGGMLETLAATQQGASPDAVAVGMLDMQLNALLLDGELYDGDRFSDTWLSDGTKGLVALHMDSTPLEGDDLRHMNRLLLEDAFPDFIEPLKNIRLAALYQCVHKVMPSALSLSGGGIRSGTFALGLMQGLARHKLLQGFDYLSTVSGGGYIGSWLSAWLHRHPEGLAGVTREMTNEDPSSKVDPDPKPIQHLRNYSNFVTPKVGLLTADTWTFIGIYLRNILINWMVFIPLMLAALMLPRLMVGVMLMQPVENKTTRLSEALKMSDDEMERLSKIDPESAEARLNADGPNLSRLKDVPRKNWIVFRPATWNVPVVGQIHPRYLLLFAGFIFGVWALGFVGFNRPGVRETLRRRSRIWRERTDQRSFLKYCLLPLIVAAVCLTTYWAWSREVQVAAHDWYYYALFGLAFTLCGWLIASYVLGRMKHPNEINWLELLLILLVGAAGGMFFWLFSYQQLLGEPVLGYGVLARDGAVVQAPIEWTNWSAWTSSLFGTELYVCLGVPAFLSTFWLAETLFVGGSSRWPRIDDEDREWWARFGAWLLIAAIVWIAFNAVVLFGPLALLNSPKLLASIGGLSGLVAVLFGRSAKTPAQGKKPSEGEQTKTGAVAGLVGSMLPLLAVAFLALLLAALSLLTTGATRFIATTYYKDGPASARAGGDALGELMTNVPNGEQPWRGFAQYVEFIEPLWTPAPSHSPAPAPAPAPEPAGQATPAQCVTMVCVPRGGEEAKALAEAAFAKGGEGDKDSFTGAKLVHMNVLHHTSVLLTLALALLLGALGTLVSWLINLNKFSLHAGYRDRLIRAFLGASRPPGERRPNPFTGFDPADNLHMHELRWALFSERDIIKPRELERALRDTSHPLSKYLSEKELLKGLGTTPDTADVAALRKTLNAVIEGEALYSAGSPGWQYMQTARARSLQRQILDAVNDNARGSTKYDTLDDARMRSDYHLLLNRLVLEEAYPKMVKLGQPPPYKLMHVINTTLNLVGGDKLAWQQRKAEPFSISPLHSGCFRVGYRDSRNYGGPNGVSIGTAAATSGAAASSNMGYYTTSPVISLLLTFFNVRLGWWLGNPGSAGRDTYYLNAPRLSFKPVLYEALGLTDDRSDYVYLTDGGHFENLAFYEMVLRRCHVIVVADGAADPDYAFGDLGNAVRKIRIDLGVPIDFPCVPIYGADDAEKKEKRAYWAVGRIRYSCVDRVEKEKGVFGPAPDGVIIYIKPAVYGDEPRDVIEYKKSNPAFPHQSTGDQFFDEPQFESYRALGSFIMDRLCGTGFERLDVGNLVGMAFRVAREQCPDALKDLTGAPMPDLLDKLKVQECDAWLEKVKAQDRSRGEWLTEMAREMRRAFEKSP
jgi:hypothetical protein